MQKYFIPHSSSLYSTFCSYFCIAAKIAGYTAPWIGLYLDEYYGCYPDDELKDNILNENICHVTKL